MAVEIKEVWPGFLGSLMHDADDAMRRHQADSSPTNRRSVIRALIAAVEGLAWIYRSHVLEIAEDMDVLVESERAALSETIFAVDDAGRISEQRRILPMVTAIRLTSRIAEKIAPDAQPDFGGPGWVDFKETIALRNRITHPKREGDLEISTEDIGRAISAFHWFVEIVISVMKKSNSAFRTHVDALSVVLELLKAGDEEMMQLYHDMLE